VESLAQEVRSLSRRVFQGNTLWRERRNSVHHYNIDYRIHRLFLDSDLQYSCAYFENSDASLDDAQLAKKRHIATKLLLRPGLKVLDIGSGWGGLGLDLAQNSKVSVVGVGMRSHAGVATKMFQTMATEGINIQMISTSEIKISVVIL